MKRSKLNKLVSVAAALVVLSVLLVACAGNENESQGASSSTAESAHADDGIQANETTQTELNDYRANNPFMQAAIEQAQVGIRSGHGGPFGSVVVKDGQIVAEGHNRVLLNNDPTCHGEIDAIRTACDELGTHDLTGYELYTTGEPCPMCLCACMWANIDKVYYGCTIEDNALIGFRDEKFDDLMGGRENVGDYLECIDREACLALFDEYNQIEDRVNY